MKKKKKARPHRSTQSYHVDDEVVNQLADFAYDEEISMSALVRRAMKNELSRLVRGKKK